MAAATPAPEDADFTANIYDFLEQLPQRQLGNLYTKPATCLAVFRLLPVLSRQTVMNMLFLDGAISKADCLAWLRKEGRKQFEELLPRLVRLSILSLGPKETLNMNRLFREGLRRALTGGGSHQSFGVPTDDPRPLDVAFLDEYAKTQWEVILHYMVGSNMEPAGEVTFLLEKSGLLIRQFTDGRRHSITSRGFQFLLEDVNTQLWDLLLQYLALAEERDMDVVDVLAFLFLLGSLELGRDYSTSVLSETQVAMLHDFRNYGIIYQEDGDTSRFYPTRLATTLTSNAAPLVSGHDDAREEKHFLILETNYRVYAYTSDDLRIAVLNLFVSIKVRFPNLVIGSITRESVKSALAKGITASQMIHFLQAHAHPQMYRNKPLLPVTVTDQIRLWEKEKNRLQADEGFLYQSFAHQSDYELCRDYAAQAGVLVWSSDVKRCFFVSEVGREIVSGFIRRRLEGTT